MRRCCSCSSRNGGGRARRARRVAFVACSGRAKSSADRAARVTVRGSSAACRLPDDSAQAPRAELFDMKPAVLSPRPRCPDGSGAVPPRTRLRRLPRSPFDDGQRRFDRALLIGCPDPEMARAIWPSWSARSRSPTRVTLFAKAGGGTDHRGAWQPEPQTMIWSSRSAPSTPSTICRSRCPVAGTQATMGSFSAAMSGGDTLPRLRSAMRAADAVSEPRRPACPSPHRSLGNGAALANAGFHQSGRGHRSVPRFLSSLGPTRRGPAAHGATNVLAQRSHAAYGDSTRLPQLIFLQGRDGGRTTETFEILHFACWTPAA